MTTNVKAGNDEGTIRWRLNEERLKPTTLLLSKSFTSLLLILVT